MQLDHLLDDEGNLDPAKLLAFHHGVFGDLRMEDDDSDDDDSGSDDDSDDDDSGSDDDSDADGDDDKEDKKLGEAGQKAFERIKARDKKNRATIRDLRAKLDAATKGKNRGGKDDEADADQIREQARKEAAAEVLATRVADKIEAKAGARFDLDPEDVAALVLRRHSVEDFLDEDNKIDVDAISDALDTLLTDRPSLASKGEKRFQGGGDGGRRKDAKPKVKSLQDAVTSRYAKSS